MKRSRLSLSVTAATLALMATMLVSCGGGGYGGGGGGMAIAPAAFTLSAPADTATGVTTTPMLTWTASLYASDYRVQIDTINTFPAPIVNTVVAAPTMNFTVPGSTLALTARPWRGRGHSRRKRTSGAEVRTGGLCLPFFFHKRLGQVFLLDYARSAAILAP
jgi:hypothetical protein